MLRKARPGDIKSIHALIDTYAKDGVMLPCALSDLYERLRDFYVYVDEDSAEVCGACALHICWEDLGEIRSLAVREQNKRQGIGKKMIAACIDEARAFGIKKVFALTYVPDFFSNFDFQIIDKSVLPHKIWADCIKCSKFPDCDETAMMKIL